MSTVTMKRMLVAKSNFMIEVAIDIPWNEMRFKLNNYMKKSDFKF